MSVAPHKTLPSMLKNPAVILLSLCVFAASACVGEKAIVSTLIPAETTLGEVRVNAQNAIIAVGAVRLIRSAGLILLEVTPSHVDLADVKRVVESVPGVVNVHDLHVWEVTSGMPAVSAHMIVGRDEDCHARRRELEQLLAAEFGIEHTTLQVDHAGDGRLVELGRF